MVGDDETLVNEKLCVARREAFLERLKAIEEHSANSAVGIGKVLRIVTEGNGKPALCTSVAENTAFRLEMQKYVKEERAVRAELAREREREQKDRKLRLTISSIGWVVMIVLFFLGVVLKI